MVANINLISIKYINSHAERSNSKMAILFKESI